MRVILDSWMACASWVCLLVVVALAGPWVSMASAQSLDVTNSTSAPAEAGAEGGSDFYAVVAAFGFAASGGSVDISGITLTPSGSGDFVADLDAGDGIAIWLDDGDGTFGTTTDTQLFAGGGSNGTISTTLTPAVAVTSGGSVSLWVRLHFTATAGETPSETFALAIVADTDVSSTAASTTIGTPSPQSSIYHVIDYAVTSFTPLTGGGGQSIVIEGSGFISPVLLTIGGVSMPVSTAYGGVPAINGSGTRIDGFYTSFAGGQPPQGSHQIVLTSRFIGPRVLPWQFVGGAAGPAVTDGGDRDSNCSTASTSGPWYLVCLLLGMFVVAARQSVSASL